jgi:hypothetical protein
LGEVLDDGDELDALAGGGRGEGVEVGQRGDVGDLVEHDEERWVKRFAGRGGAVVDLGEDAGDQGDEQRSQALLFVLGCAQVGGAALAVEQPVGGQVGVA